MHDYSRSSRNNAEENQAWIRETMARKGIQNDPRKLIMKLPMQVINGLFFTLMEREMPDHAGS
jgi:hypothetical protein